MLKMIGKTRGGNAPQEPTTNGRCVVKHYFAVGGLASVSVLLFIKKL